MLELLKYPHGAVKIKISALCQVPVPRIIDGHGSAELRSLHDSFNLSPIFDSESKLVPQGGNQQCPDRSHRIVEKAVLKMDCRRSLVTRSLKSSLRTAFGTRTGENSTLSWGARSRWSRAMMQELSIVQRRDRISFSFDPPALTRASQAPRSPVPTGRSLRSTAHREFRGTPSRSCACEGPDRR